MQYIEVMSGHFEFTELIAYTLNILRIWKESMACLCRCLFTPQIEEFPPQVVFIVVVTIYPLVYNTQALVFVTYII